jgi:hypothetical protein
MKIRSNNAKENSKIIDHYYFEIHMGYDIREPDTFMLVKEQLSLMLNMMMVTTTMIISMI